MKTRIKNFLLRRFGYHRAIWVVVFAEVLLFVMVALSMALLFLYAANRCWFGWFGPSRIDVVQRSYQLENDVFQINHPTMERRVANKNIALSVKLSWKRRCYCSDIYGEIHNYENRSGRFVETIQGGGKLLLTNSDATILKGEWIRPPTGRYRLKIWLKCASRADEHIDIFDFVTFVLEDRKD